MYRYLTVLFLAIAAPGLALAQGFVTPVTGVPTSEGSYVLLKDGRRFEGKVKSAMLMGPYIRSLSFVTSDGEKLKVKADDVEQLGAKLGKLSKFMLVTESLGDPGTPWGVAQAFRDVDWQAIVNRKYAIYDQALIPGKDNWRLVQLLNPGFESRLKVYQHFRKTTTMANEGKVTTYLMVKDGQKAFVVKKKGYEEQFVQVFGDCESFREFPGKPSFDDFAGHVFLYDQACKPEGNEPG